MSDTRMVALLRGINVGGNRIVPMAELREVATGLGLRDVGTYIQSGNILFSASQTVDRVASALEAAISARFGFDAEVIVRTQAQWNRSRAEGPFGPAAEGRPKFLHLCLSRRPPRANAAEVLAPLCSINESVALVGDALWVDFGEGAARSKLTPAALDRAGSTVTARNWNTVEKLAALLG